MTFSDFLIWEETHISRLLSYRANNGIHYWPVIRVFYAKCYLETVNNLSNPHAPTTGVSLIGKLRWVYRAIFKSFLFAPKAPLYVFGSSVVNMKEGSTYTNRIYDTLKTKVGNNMVLCEESYRYVFRTPRKVTTYSSDLFYVFAYVYGKFIALSESEKIKIDSFMAFIIENSICQFSKEHYSVMSKAIKNAVIRYRFYLRVAHYLKQAKQVKACMIEDASYGMDRVVFIHALFNIGIKTLEHQHGLVAKNHPAYNYPEAIVDKKNIYFQYLPEYYMTFGDYWSTCVRIPSERLVFGFPYLIKKAKQRSMEGFRESIIVVSDGTMPKFNLDVCNVLKSILKPGERIILKLHPGEVPYLNERYGALLGCENTYIKTYEPIYDLLSSAKIVVGFTSTVMVEALAYGIKPFVYKTNYSEEIFNGIEFNYFSSIKELEEVIKKNDGKTNINTRYYWEFDSEKRYVEFFSSIGVIE